MSRGFVSAIIGIGMTLFAWYGPWAWPAWPAFTAIESIFGQGGFADLPYAERSAVLVALIILNVGSWGVVAWGVIWSGSRIGRQPDDRSSEP